MSTEPTPEQLQRVAELQAQGTRVMAALIDELPKALVTGRLEAWQLAGSDWLSILASTAAREVGMSPEREAGEAPTVDA